MSGPEPEYDTPALEYASDDDYQVSGDEWDATPTKVPAAGGYITQGARPNRQLGSQNFNWVMSQLGKAVKKAIENILLIETQLTWKLDKRAGQFENLGSVVNTTGAGRIIDTIVVGANVDTTYLADGPNRRVRLTNAITTAGLSYTLSNDGAREGDTILVTAEDSMPTQTVAFVNLFVTVKNAAGVALHTIGNVDACSATWAEFIFAGGAWRTARAAKKAIALPPEPPPGAPDLTEELGDLEDRVTELEGYVPPEGAPDLSARVIALETTTAPLADLVALMALPSPPDGTTRLVELYGWYVYEDSSTTEVKSPWILAPDDSLGTGRWRRAGMHRRKMHRAFGAARPHLVSAHNATRSKDAGFYSKEVPPVTEGGDYIANGFYYFVGGVGIFNWQPDATTTQGVMWDITDLLVEGAILEKITAIIEPIVGRSALPTTPMSIGIFVSDPVTGSMTSLRAEGDFVNDPASLATYETRHGLHYTTTQHRLVSKAFQTYYLQVWNDIGPSGTVYALNKLFGLYVMQSQVADLKWGDDY